MDPEDGHFLLDATKSSSELAELILKQMLKNPSQRIMISRISSVSTAMSQIAVYIDTYHQEISDAQNDDEKKLTAIIGKIYRLYPT